MSARITGRRRPDATATRPSHGDGLGLDLGALVGALLLLFVGLTLLMSAGTAVLP